MTDQPTPEDLGLDRVPGPDQDAPKVPAAPDLDHPLMHPRPAPSEPDPSVAPVWADLTEEPKP